MMWMDKNAPTFEYYEIIWEFLLRHLCIMMVYFTKNMERPTLIYIQNNMDLMGIGIDKNELCEYKL